MERKMYNVYIRTYKSYVLDNEDNNCRCEPVKTYTKE